MDGTVDGLQPTTVQPAPHRSRWPLVAGVGVLVLIVAAGVTLLIKRGGVGPETPPPAADQGTPEQRQAIEQTVRQNQNEEQLQNLVAIHVLLAEYRQQNQRYPDSLDQLADLRGYSPDMARDLAGAKLANGQPTYTYAKSGDSYEVCANQISGEAKCEGPK